MTKEEKRREWKTRYDAWKASGMQVAPWCREQGIKASQMYYWVRKYEKHVVPKQDERTQWTPVHVEDDAVHSFQSASVFIHFDSLSVEVRPGADMALLSDVVQVLTYR